MHQMENIISAPVIIFVLAISSILTIAQENSLSSVDSFSESDFDYNRPQDFGLGKRVYGYLSEYKRYPVYNFGLGKRSSHLYNFGLGKRSRIEESGDDLDDYDEYSYNEDDRIPELELYHDDMMQNMDKRQKLYSFGLGKRINRYDFGLGKRGQVHRYDFGLGKRSQPVLNRDRLYNFGLGKRNRLYSFGLGKRPFNQGPVPGRFNFGLGKRSEEDFDISKNIIAKREVHEENSSEAAVQEDKPTTDPNQASTSKFEKLSSNIEPESHEIMGHPGKSQVSKRSSYRYAFESRKPVFRSNSGFSRQFRKPLYNFGLGKRTPLSNNLAKNDKSEN